MNTTNITSTKDHSFMVILIILTIALSVCVANAAQPKDFWPHSTEIRASKTVLDQDSNEILIDGIFNSMTGAPVRVHGGFEEVEFSGTPSTTDILDFIDENLSVFVISREQMKIARFEQFFGKTVFIAEQLIDGKPVLNTQINVRVGASGKIVLWGADVVEVDEMHWTASITPSTAVELLSDNAELFADVTVLSIDNVWIRDGNSIISAYRIDLFSVSQYDRFVGLVSSIDGEILGLSRQIMNATISGTVTAPIFERNPLTDAETQPLSSQYVKIDEDALLITDSAGYFSMMTTTTWTMAHRILRKY